MTTPALSIGETLRQAIQTLSDARIDTPGLDAEVLLAHTLGCERAVIHRDHAQALTRDAQSRFHALIERRLAYEPVAYLTGEKEFYGRNFHVNKNVLVPRPDTETLVEVALQCLAECAPQAPQLLELGTGSGAIALTLAAEQPTATVDACDLSAEALGVARSNAQRLGLLDRVRFFQGDLFAALPTQKTYHLIAANLPYITEADLCELPADIRYHEPTLALSGGVDGLDIIRRAVAGAPPWLSPQGFMVLEMGADQEDAAKALFWAAPGWSTPKVRNDLSGFPRVVYAQRVS